MEVMGRCLCSCLLVWPGRANRGKWSSWKERVGSRPWLLWDSKVVALACVDYGPRRFSPGGQALICTDRMSGFMGLGKLSSLVTTLSNHTSLLRGGLVEGEWGNPAWRPSWTITESQDFISGVWAWFQPSRDFMEGCRTWDPRSHAYDVLVRFFPCRVYINLNHRDTLEYKSPLARCCHMIVCVGG
jgi:hypothetical protein